MTKMKLATMVPPSAATWTNAYGETVVMTFCGPKVFDTQAAANEWQAGNRVRGTVAEVTQQVERLRGQVRSVTEREIESAKKRGLRFVEVPDPAPHRTQWNRTGSTEFMACRPALSREECRERAREFERRTGQR